MEAEQERSLRDRCEHPIDKAEIHEVRRPDKMGTLKVTLCGVCKKKLAMKDIDDDQMLSSPRTCISEKTSRSVGQMIMDAHKRIWSDSLPEPPGNTTFLS